MDGYETTQPGALVLSLMSELKSERQERRTAAVVLIEAIGARGWNPKDWLKLMQDIERRYGQATAREAKRLASPWN